MWDQAIAADGLIAGLRLLKEEGLIQNVSLGMNANADHKVVTPGEGGLENKEKTSSIDPPSSRKSNADIVKSAAKLGTRQKMLIAQVADGALL